MCLQGVLQAVEMSKGLGQLLTVVPAYQNLHLPYVFTPLHHQSCQSVFTFLSASVIMACVVAAGRVIRDSTPPKLTATKGIFRLCRYVT